MTFTVTINEQTAADALVKAAELLRELGQPVVQVTANEVVDWLESSGT